MNRAGIGIVVAIGILGVVAGLWWTRGTTPVAAPAAAPTPPVPAADAAAAQTARVTRRVPAPPIPAPAPPEPDLDRTVCADLEAVGSGMLASGTLTEAQLACLDARIADDDDAEGVLRLLTIHAYETDRPLWARRSVQLAALTVDPDLHYKLALHFAKDAQPEVALHHLEVTLEEAHVWDDETAQKRTDKLEKLRASLCAGLEDAADYAICD